jgi:RNA polymerase sigma-70 factor, ECF subfamily
MIGCRRAVATIDPDLLAAARAAWPEVDLDDATLVTFVGEIVPDGAPRELDLPTLYLACACLRGDPRALAAFERTYLAQLPQFLARLTTDAAVIDEVRQRLRIKLFVGTPPTITRYTRGTFTAWLRVVACRLAIDLLRERDQPLVPRGDDALEQRALTADPALALVKARYQAQVSAAFAAALAALPPADRAMLRLCFVDDLGLAEIGRIYQLSKSAVSRRLSRCRADLVADVKRRLHDELGVAEADLDSIMRLVTSQLHLSLPRLLRG